MHACRPVAHARPVAGQCRAHSCAALPRSPEIVFRLPRSGELEYTQTAQAPAETPRPGRSPVQAFWSASRCSLESSILTSRISDDVHLTTGRALSSRPPEAPAQPDAQPAQFLGRGAIG